MASTAILSAPNTSSNSARHLAFRDRTQELRSIFELYKQNSTASINAPTVSSSSSSTSQKKNIPPIKKKQTVQQQSEELRRFNDAASRFSVDLSQLAGTVGNLTRLTQKGGGSGSSSFGGSGSSSAAASAGGAFDENGQEISRLTQVVRSRLGQLHDDLNNLADLKEASDSAAAYNNTSSGSSTSNVAMSKHNDAVIAALRSKLVGTGNNFRQVLTKQTQDIKNAGLRRSKLLADRSSSTNFLAHASDDGNSSSTTTSESHALASSTGLMQEQRNLDYLKNRQQAVQEIEVAVREVGELVNDFTRLVYEQDETIIRIDNDVDDALQNVNAGSGELMKYLASLTAQRGFILKILGVLFFFLLFFGFFIVR